MQGKSLYAVLLSIIAVLALALAVMVIFLFTTYNRINPNPEANNAKDLPQQTREVPPDEESRKPLLGGRTVGIFNLKASPLMKTAF